MTTLLIAEHDHAALKDVTGKALTAAAQLGAPVDVLVAGEKAGGAAEEAAPGELRDDVRELRVGVGLGIGGRGEYGSPAHAAPPSLPRAASSESRAPSASLYPEGRK